MSADIIGRRMLLGLGAGVGALALAAPRAEADTPFSSYAFAATGAPSARTMPDRLAEIKNVKDFGATGNGSTDDTAAIQAAVNRTSAPFSSGNRGTIYFPTGTYRITAPITWETPNMHIRFLGEPGAMIVGNFADALLKRSVNSPIGGVHVIENLQFMQGHASGKGVMAHSCIPVKIANCAFWGPGGTNNTIALETYNSQAATVDSCLIIGWGVGVMAGNGTMVLDCDITGCTHGVRHQNVGLTVFGGRYEMNTVAIVVGLDQNGNGFQSSGFDISGLSMEANQTAIYIAAGAAGKISACSIQSGVPISYGLRLGSVQDTLVQGVICGGPSVSQAGISIEGATRLSLVSCLSTPGSGTPWNIAPSLQSFSLSQCNATITVAKLPYGAPVGTILPVSDATSTTSGSTVVGGGSNQVAVVRSAGAWRII